MRGFHGGVYSAEDKRALSKSDQGFVPLEFDEPGMNLFAGGILSAMDGQHVAAFAALSATSVQPVVRWIRRRSSFAATIRTVLLGSCGLKTQLL
jgi:hypothetical protein